MKSSIFCFLVQFGKVLNIKKCQGISRGCWGRGYAPASLSKTSSSLHNTLEKKEKRGQHNVEVGDFSIRKNLCEISFVLSKGRKIPKKTLIVLGFIAYFYVWWSIGNKCMPCFQNKWPMDDCRIEVEDLVYFNLKTVHNQKSKIANFRHFSSSKPTSIVKDFHLTHSQS